MKTKDGRDIVARYDSFEVGSEAEGFPVKVGNLNLITPGASKFAHCLSSQSHLVIDCSSL